MQLTQQETNKIKERDEQHTQELREWRNDLAKRKQVTNDDYYYVLVASGDSYNVYKLSSRC